MMRALAELFGERLQPAGGAQIREGAQREGAPAAAASARPVLDAPRQARVEPAAPSSFQSLAHEPAGGGAHAAQTPPSAADKEARRDRRLDFFRGLGMFIILIAHIPWNGWNSWIPARFGFSDATEIFVFCSGAASAIAFLKTFEQKGWWAGTARVGYRIYQLYWCHIGVFFATLAVLTAVNQSLADPARDYVGVLNLARFVADPAAFLPSLFTLSYVPNYFDILVMYMVILAMMPVVVALAWWRPWAALAFSVAVWALASQPWLAVLDVPVFTGFNLPAEPVGEPRTWFFNPFAWQLIFFTGFAFSVGWLPKPPVSRALLIAAGLIAFVSIFLDPDGVPAYRLLNSWEGFAPLRDAVRDFQAATGPLHSKSFFGLFRYLHFLAIAYLVWVAAGEAGSRLPRRGIGGAVVTIVRRVGQQSLAVFIASLVLARVLGVVLMETGITETPGQPRETSLLVNALVNLLGFALIIGVAYIARYFRNPPWRKA